jgi:hypothetical protein
MNQPCNPDPYDNPVCLPDPSDCPQPIEKGYASRKKYVSCAPPPDEDLCAEGTGHGTSSVSQEEADQQALERAQEDAARRLGWKMRLLNFLGFFHPLEKEQFKFIAPLGTRDEPVPWEGRSVKKPWEYKVTAAIPHLDTPEPLKWVVEILRRQTEKPYIIIVDTGSDPRVKRELELLRAPDLEIHYLMSNSYRHSSEPVTAALDLVQSICKTEFLFHTHADVFLRTFTVLEDLMKITGKENPVVGYRMSPRDWVTTDWEWMVGHTALMLHMPKIHEIGATWSMQRMHKTFGYDWESKASGWPDTEIGFNNVLKQHGVTPKFIGYDENYRLYQDDRITHVRSYPGSKIYCGDLYKQASEWMDKAINAAKLQLSGK